MNWASSRKTIKIQIFEEFYFISVDACHLIGDVLKTIGLWMDEDPSELSISNNFNCRQDEKIWDSINKGGLDITIECRKGLFNLTFCKIIIFEPR
jgi:hypothetical protein